jgi:hypothetical protein
MAQKGKQARQVPGYLDINTLLRQLAKLESQSSPFPEFPLAAGRMEQTAVAGLATFQ